MSCTTQHPKTVTNTDKLLLRNMKNEWKFKYSLLIGSPVTDANTSYKEEASPWTGYDTKVVAVVVG